MPRAYNITVGGDGRVNGEQRKASRKREAPTLHEKQRLVILKQSRPPLGNKCRGPALGFSLFENYDLYGRNCLFSQIPQVHLPNCTCWLLEGVFENVGRLFVVATLTALPDFDLWSRLSDFAFSLEHRLVFKLTWNVFFKQEQLV
jgi:hypothetical protein